MAITRKVDTDVYCDICGKWVMGWTSNNDGVSRAWAAKYARKKGCTVGKKIICKECRIEKRIQTCSIQQKIGSAGRDSDGTCMGFGGEASDEPLEKCKQCIACTSYQWKLSLIVVTGKQNADRLRMDTNMPGTTAKQADAKQ